jgi:hypothetical protein
MSDSDKYPDPQALVEFLSQPGIKKKKGQMADAFDPQARCCLGHYAHLAGMKFRPGDCSFYTAMQAKGTLLPVLRDDHWLLSKVDNEFYSLQNHLSNANDTTDGFDEVIKLLKDFIANSSS